MAIDFDPKVKNDSNILDREIQIALTRSKGLTVIPAPTGSSKTYNLTRNIARFILTQNGILKSDIAVSRFIVLIPNLNNIPTNEDIAERICDLIDCSKPTADKIVKQNVMYMESNFRCMVEGISKHPDIADKISECPFIGAEQKGKILPAIESILKYSRLCEELEMAKRDMHEGSNNSAILKNLFGYKQELENNAKNGEAIIRKEFHGIMRSIRKIEKASKKKKDEEKRARWERNRHVIESWICDFFRLANYRNYCVWIMSVDKFIRPFDPIIEPTFWLYNKNRLKDSVVFMDESDSAYDRMLNSIINEVNNSSIRIKELMEVITSSYFHKTLTKRVENAMNEAFPNTNNSCRLENLRENGDKFRAKYHLELAYKTDDKSLESGVMPALLNDGRLYNLGEGRHYIRATRDSNRQQVMLTLGNREKKIEVDENEIDMGSFFYDAMRLIKKFSSFLTYTADAYRDFWKKDRHPFTSVPNDRDKIVTEELEMTDALYTVMNSLDMSDRDKDLFIDLCLRKLSGVSPTEYFDTDFSFFTRGYDLKMIKDNPEKQAENSVIEMYWAWTTPEKILLTMASAANVIWSSATALNRSINENFAVPYLKEQLGEYYFEITEEGKRALREFYKYKNKPYYDGEWKIEVTALPEMAKRGNDKVSVPAMEAKKHFKHPELFNKIVDSLSTFSFEDYVNDRYFNLVHVMADFIHNPMLHSLVCLEKPSLGINPKYSLNMITEFKNIICRDADIDPARISIFTAVSGNFKQTMDEVKSRWANGEKAILFSTYATTSKGSNLQYDIPNDLMVKAALVELAPELKEIMPTKYSVKDIDCLYLGNYTFLYSKIEGNTDMERSECFHRIIFETEKLYALNQINFMQKRYRIRSAFMKLDSPKTNNKNWERSLLKIEGIRNTLNKVVKQSVGRMERSNIKNCLTKIYIAEEILKNMDAKELRDTEKDLIPGMQEIKKVADTYRNEKEDMVTEAEDENKRVCLYAAKQHRRSCLMFSRLLHTMRQGENGRQKTAIERYNMLRELVLKAPILTNDSYMALSETEKRLVRQFYIDTGRDDVVSYGFESKEDNQYLGGTDLDNLWIDVKGFNQGESDNIQEAKTNLQRLLKVEGVPELFASKGYATSWGKGRFILTPKGRDIYNGILGEIVAKYILDNLLTSMKVVFRDMPDAQIEELAPEVVEKFDFKLGRLYIDVKNWRYGVARFSAKEFKAHTLQKRDECDEFYGKPGAAIILNLLPENDAISNEQPIQEENYVEIRRLLNDDYTVNEKAKAKLVSMIRKAVTLHED